MNSNIDNISDICLKCICNICMYIYIYKTIAFRNNIIIIIIFSS